MAEGDFKEFCSDNGIVKATWQVLMDNGVTDERLLSDLRDEDFDTDPKLKQLSLGQRRRLQKVARGLRDAPNQTRQSDNNYCPPPATSILKRERTDQTQKSDNNQGPPPATSVLKREPTDQTRQSANSHGPPPATSVLKKEDTDEEDPDELRIVLIGKTGSGKSSVGNTILNLTEETGGFDPACGQAAATTTCKRRSVVINGKKIRLIDTPGVYDPARSAEDVAHEIVRCLMLCSPGPHALLFVCKGHERFTNEEIEAYYALKAMFDIEIRNYITVVFTGGDVLDKWGETMEDVLKKAKAAIESNKGTRRAKPPPDVTKVLEDASNRYILFNNEDDAEAKDQQVFDLLEMVTEMVNNNGDKPYFQDARTRFVWEARERKLQHIMSEEGLNRTEALEVLFKRLEREEKWNRFVTVVASTCICYGAALTAGAVVVAAPLIPVAAITGAAVAGGAAVGGAAAKKYCSIM